MANRRKFLAGLGALASGSAAAMGTGAFTSVSANRDVNVDVAGDQSAYLKLSDSSSYSNIQGGELHIDFESGGGVNTAAETAFDEVFKIKNRGTQAVNVWVTRYSYTNGGAQSLQVVTGDQNLQSDASSPEEIDIAQPPARSASDIAPAGNSGDGLSENGPEVRPGGYVALGSGKEASIGVNFFVNDVTGDYNKEWQINAATTPPVADDYDDDSLEGHGSNDDLTDAV